MTQELILWVLSAGLVGISWPMVFAITSDHRRTAKGGRTHDGTEIEEDGVPSHRGMGA